jgi:hypothetical protein
MDKFNLSTLKIAMTMLVNYLQSNKAMDGDKFNEWIRKKNKDKEYPIGLIIEDAYKLPVAIENIFAILLKYEDKARKSGPNFLAKFMEVIEEHKPKTSQKYTIPKLIDITNNDETNNSSQTSSKSNDNDTVTSKETNKVIPVDENKEFKETYFKYKGVKQQVELLTMHQRSNTLPNALCRGRFPPCPTPSEKEFVILYDSIIEKCQNELLNATLEFNTKRTTNLEEKCKILDINLKPEVTDQIRLDINATIRNKGNTSSSNSYRLTGNQGKNKFLANKLQQKIQQNQNKRLEPKVWEQRQIEQRHRSGSTHGRHRSAPYTQKENTRP